MTTPVLLPDVEQLVVDYMLSVDALTDLVGEHVGTELDGHFPFLQVQRPAGGPQGLPLWIDRPRLQFSGWDEKPSLGGSKRRAFAVASTALSVAMTLPDVDHELGVVTDVTPALGPLWLPDRETARPRYIVDVILTLHPHRQS